MDTIRTLISDAPAVWRELSAPQQVFVVLKAITDLTFCIVPPLVFNKSHIGLRTLLYVPMLGVCYLVPDVAIYFALPKSADATQTGIAVLLIIYSLVFFWWARYTMATTPLTACFSPDEPTFLITNGPFALVRNPFYSAYLATLLAGFIVTSSANHPDHGHAYLVSHAGSLALSALLVSLAIFYYAIRDEEAKFSASKLRTQHEAYKRRVWCLLPLTDVMRR